MTALSVYFLLVGLFFRLVERLYSLCSNATLENNLYRWLPFTWQFGGAASTLFGLLAGTNELSDTGIHLAILAFLTGVYLSLFVGDRRRPQDIMAVMGYFMYAAGFGFLSAPSRFQFGEWTLATYALGALFIALLLPLTWALFVGYLVDVDIEAHRQ